MIHIDAVLDQKGRDIEVQIEYRFEQRTDSIRITQIRVRTGLQQQILSDIKTQTDVKVDQVYFTDVAVQ